MTDSRYVDYYDLEVKREIHADATNAEGHIREEWKESARVRSQVEVGGTMVGSAMMMQEPKADESDVFG